MLMTFDGIIISFLRNKYMFLIKLRYYKNIVGTKGKHKN